MVIILFLFSILIRSFSSTHKFYFVFYSLSCPTGKEGENSCDAQPPAGLNHNSFPGLYYFLLIFRYLWKNIKSFWKLVWFPALQNIPQTMGSSSNFVFFWVLCLRQFHSLNCWTKICKWSTNQPFDAVHLPETKTTPAQMIDTYSGWQLVLLIGSCSFWNELDRVKSSQS